MMHTSNKTPVEVIANVPSLIISYRSNMRRFQIMLTRGPLVDRNENLHK